MEFLFENPFILVILLGIISSLFKKGKGEEQPRQRPPKPFVESIPIPEQDVFQEMKQVEREIKASDPIKNFQQDYMETKKQAEAKIQALKEQQLKYEQKAKRISSQSEPSPSHLSQAEKSLRADERNLVDAVIWAEILGPPRSKKAHRSFRP